jgi:hypothetical protein
VLFFRTLCLATLTTQSYKFFDITDTWLLHPSKFLTAQIIFHNRFQKRANRTSKSSPDDSTTIKPNPLADRTYPVQSGDHVRIGLIHEYIMRKAVVKNEPG